MPINREEKNILRMEDYLNPSTFSDPVTGSEKPEKSTPNNTSKPSTLIPKGKPSTLIPKGKPSTLIPKGKPKSGRFWKSEKKKFSSNIKTKGLKSSFERKQALREKLLKVKEASKERKARKAEEEEMRKQRRRDNLKRQEENRKKSEVVQVITNTKKLKKMKKKHLRFIEKRDTTIVAK